MTSIMTTWILSEIILFVIAAVFVHLYITQSVELDIRRSLSRQVSSLSDNFVVKDVSIEVDEQKLERQYPDMYIAIIDSDGNVVWGSAPDGVKVNARRSMAPVKVSSGGVSYYYIDRDIKYTSVNSGFVRAYVSEGDILGKYIPIRLIAYGGMMLAFAALTTIMLFALRRFRRSVKKMASSVEKIGTSRSFKMHMDSSGYYKEISSLVEANNRMLDRMKEDFDRQEQFSSDIAHELRTPISVIKAQSQFALNNYDLSPDERQSFEVVLRQAGKMQELIVTLLELSRLDSRNSEVERETVDLTEIVAAVCDSYQYINSDKNISFNIKNNNIPETLGDVSLVTVAVSNLVSNAVKFSPDNGVIDVETGEEDDCVYVMVKDRGVGMTEDEKSRVFTRFFKSDSSRNGSGYGLGMPLALKIAEKHGGTITVDSEPGKGSRFVLKLKK